MSLTLEVTRTGKRKSETLRLEIEEDDEISAELKLDTVKVGLFYLKERSREDASLNARESETIQYTPAPTTTSQNAAALAPDETESEGGASTSRNNNEVVAIRMQKIASLFTKKIEQDSFLQERMVSVVEECEEAIDAPGPGDEAVEPQTVVTQHLKDVFSHMFSAQDLLRPNALLARLAVFMEYTYQLIRKYIQKFGIVKSMLSFIGQVFSGLMKVLSLLGFLKQLLDAGGIRILRATSEINIPRNVYVYAGVGALAIAAVAGTILYLWRRAN